MPLTCPDRAILRQLLDGQLPPAETELLAQHLEQCKACGAAAASYASDASASLRLPADKATAADTAIESLIGRLQQAGPGRRGGTPVRPQFPDYEILDELGRGGMGVVYKARDMRLGRLVALKVIRAGEHADAKELSRFRKEAEAIARMQHPNFVQIFEVGEHDGLPYLTLEYCSGGTLAARLQGQPLTPDEAAQLVEVLARAVAAAHECSIVHRDLKPANILFTDSQRTTPKIGDFGLAKQLDTVSDETATGAIVGTPSYMAPEQAKGQGKHADAAADIYALGAILYECLTGRPPFRGPNAIETLLLVQQQETVPPRLLQPHVPRDLDTSCLKCLRKEPTHRYASALDLAEDLRRFQAGEPIRARPVGHAERLARWCRRNPLLAGAVATAVMGLLTAAVLGTAFALHANRTSATLREQKGQLQDALVDAKTQTKQAERRLSENLLDRGLTLCLAEGDPAHGLHWLVRALQYAPAEAAPLQRVIRMNLDAWGRQLLPLQKILPGTVAATAFSPDGKSVLTADRDSVRLWDVNGKPLGPPLQLPEVTHVAFSPDGKVMLAAGGKGFGKGVGILWETATMKQLDTLPLDTTPRWVKFSVEGKKLVIATRNGTARLWDAVTGLPLTEPLEHAKEGEVFATFNSDGTRIITIGSGIGRFWDAATGLPIGAPVPNVSGDLMADDLTSPRKPLATGGGHHTAGDGRLFDRETLKPVGRALTHLAWVNAMAISPNGEVILTASKDKTARLWSTNTGMPLCSPLAHGAEVMSVAFSPDGKLFLTGDSAGLARLWETASAKSYWAPVHHGNSVTAVAFSADGSCFLTAGHRYARTAYSGPETVRLWSVGKLPDVRLRYPEAEAAVFHPEGMIADAHVGTHAAEFSADGQHVATGDGDGRLRIWDLKTRAILASTEPPLPMWARDLMFSPDGKAILGWGPCSGGWVARLWDRATGKPLGPELNHEQTIVSAAFSPDGKRIAVGINVLATDGSRTFKGMVGLWDPYCGALVSPPLQLPHRVTKLAFSRDGNTLLAAGGDKAAAGDVRRWHVAPHPFPLSPKGRGERGEGLEPPLCHGSMVEDLVISDDGANVFTVSGDTIRRWHLASAKEIGLPMRHDGDIVSLSLGLGGKTVLSAGHFSARLWHAQTGSPACPPLLHPDPVESAASSPDDSLILTGGRYGGLARLWDTATGKQVGPTLPHQFPGVNATGFSPDGRFFLTRSFEAARLWKTPTPTTAAPDDIQRWLEVATGCELTDDYVFRHVEISDWEERKRDNERR